MLTSCFVVMSVVTVETTVLKSSATKPTMGAKTSQPYRHLQKPFSEHVSPKRIRASNIPASELNITVLRASNPDNCTNQSCILIPPIPGRHGPILPATATTAIQSSKPPILPIHLPSSRLRAFHSLTSTIRLWPAASLTVLPELRRVWGSPELWGPRCQWAHGRAGRTENRLDCGVWDGRV